MYSDINKQDSQGNTALHHAAILLPWKSEPETRRLLEYGADPNVQNVFGNTPLMLAAMVNNHRTMRLLIENDADVNMRNDEGLSVSDMIEERIQAGERMLAAA